MTAVQDSELDTIRKLSRTEATQSEGPAQGFGASPLPHPQPPPPPPPPAKNRRLKQVGQQASGYVARFPLRYQLALGGVAVLVGTVTFTRMFVHTVDEQAITRNAAQLAYNEVRAELDAAKAESTQIAVSSPFSWAKCPLSTEARVMIGGDPATGGKTINVDRAAPLEQQATTLLTAFRMVDLRLVATSQSQLRVVADNPTAGVSLFSCTNDSTEPAPAPAPTVVEVPSDPAPAAVQQ